MEQTFEQGKSGTAPGRKRFYSVLIIVAIFIIGTVQGLGGRTGTITAQVDSNVLGVIGTNAEPVFVYLEEITQVELIESMDFGVLIDGQETKNTMSGVYQNDAFGVYTLHVYKTSSPYIVVRYEGRNTLVFNQKAKRYTQDIFDDLS